jgi:hypothetical protein
LKWLLEKDSFDWPTGIRKPYCEGWRFDKVEFGYDIRHFEESNTTVGDPDASCFEPETETEVCFLIWITRLMRVYEKEKDLSW